MSTRRERFQYRQYMQRQRDFDEREIDPVELANRRHMLGLPEPPVRTPEERREDSVRRIQGEAHIGEEIAQYLPEARDRSHLVSHRPTQGFLLAPGNRDRACLPNDNLTFRTNPESSGCGPFTNPDNSCCIQSDLNFLSKVAAIVRGKEDGLQAGRIETESYRWIDERRPDLLPFHAVVDLDISDPDNVRLLKLACMMKTDAPIRIGLSDPDMDLPHVIDDFGFPPGTSLGVHGLRGDVTVYAADDDIDPLNAPTISMRGLKDLFNAPSWRRLTMECPWTPHGHFSTLEVSAFWLDVLIRHFKQDVAEFNLMLPAQHPVQTIENLLVENHNWAATVDGLTRTQHGRVTTLRSDPNLNRLLGRSQRI